MPTPTSGQRDAALRSSPLLLACAVAAMACAGGDAPQPTSPSVMGPNAALTGTCDLTPLRSSARTYFGSGNHPVFDDIRQLQDACRAAQQSTATDEAFDVLAWVATVVRAGTQAGTPAQGAEVALAALAFADVGPLPAASALTRALSSEGMFEVRGKNRTFEGVHELSAAVYSRDAVAGLRPAWGATPPPGLTWASSVARFLLYGYPLTFVDEIVTNEDPIAYGYELTTLPAGITFPNGVIRGVCVNSDAVETARVQRHSAQAGNAVVFLPFAELDCDSAFGADGPVNASLAPAEQDSPVLALARRAWGLFAPKPAWALAVIKGVGGLGSGFSAHIGVELLNVNSAFVAGPANGYVFTPILDLDGQPLRVLVTAAGGSPVANAVVTLRVGGNSGTNVRVSLDGVTYAETVSVTTGPDGIATFTGLRVNKTGGYVFSATADFDGIGGATALSTLANFQKP